MKALPLLLVASLVANAALVTVAFRSSSSAPGDTRPSASGPTQTVAGTSATPTNGDFKLSPEVVAALNGNDPGALRDLLRAAGLSDEMVRSLVQMRVWKNYEARFKALHPQPDPNQPWWKDNREQQNRWGGMTKAQREESRRLHREVRDETERLLGPENNKSQRGWQDQRLAFLPEDKVKALRDIQQDYQELISEVHQDSQGFRLASDAEKLRFLQEEQKRDIEALMTPEERQAYELRMSNTAQQLRHKMTQFDATEQEYLAIFPLQKDFDEKYNPPHDGYSPQPERDQNYWKERREAEKQLQEKIQSVIGEERYAASLRMQDNDWRQLEAATRRLDLPPETPSRLFALRDTAAADVQQIAANAALGFDEKKAALAAIAARTRDQIRNSLGAEGAEAYFKNNGMGWLKELEKGNTITFRENATGWDTKALPKPPKPPAAK